jgi:hypothetical protein
MATTVTSCSKDDNNNNTPPANTTALELTIKTADAVGSVVSGATVKLYGTQSDWINGTNQVGATQTSGADGKVKFTNLDAKKYYFSVSKADGCLSNAITIPVTYSTTTGQATAIPANQTTSLAIPVTGTTNLTFHNTSTNAWTVSIVGAGQNGEDAIYYTIPAGYNNLVPMPIGTYTIKMQEVGADGNPTETAPLTFDQELDCGGTSTVSFPAQ